MHKTGIRLYLCFNKPIRIKQKTFHTPKPLQVSDSISGPQLRPTETNTIYVLVLRNLKANK
jgi:hypothetical protein